MEKPRLGCDCSTPRGAKLRGIGVKIAYITAGAAGMFCGSCMHDNTLAKAMIKQGHDVSLVPLYTPIRTDESSATINRVFFGGINVYLQQKSAWFRALPRWTNRWLDWPWLIQIATSFGIQTEAKMLGELAVSMLEGSHGKQQQEVEYLAAWLAEELRPDVVIFSNMLMSGSMPEIRRRRDVPVFVTLQGDDIFLNGLTEPFRSRSLAEIQKLDSAVTGYIVNSHYYADFMSEFLQLPRDKFHIVPLGIDTSDLATLSRQDADKTPPTIGFLARLAPEKGLHLLVDAYLKVKQQPDLKHARLHIAGWLGPQHKAYVNEQFAKLRAAGHSDDFHYAGEVDRAGKLRFLQSLDVLSVPTTYREPKGLYVLEALAAGVPVVQPHHGAFPELLSATQGGVLVTPENTDHLAEELSQLLRDDARRQALSAAGRASVLAHFHADAIAERTLAVLATAVK